MIINEKRTIHHFIVVTGLISVEIVGTTSSTLVLVAVLVLVLILVLVTVTVRAVVDVVIRVTTLVALTTSRPVVLLVGSWVVVVLGSRRSADVHQVTISLTLSTKSTWHLCGMVVLSSVAQRVRSGVWFLGWVLCYRWGGSNHVVPSLALLVA